jgi:DNA (cytosine-5)-methyltransferase 1
MNVLDLFSGIGGFSLGLERAGMRTVAFCEIDPYCQRVLRRHWPSVPCYDDVRSLTAERLRADGIAADVIAGGFPCQDISEAGKGIGIDGERSGLWVEYARIIGDVRPYFVIVENTAVLLTRGLQRVIGDLASVGYDAEWSIISACALGAPHPRERMFVVAYPQSGWRQQRGRLQFNAISEVTRNLHQWFSKSEPVRVAHGVPARMDRLRALGNAVVPQIPELIGRAIMRVQP